MFLYKVAGRSCKFSNCFCGQGSKNIVGSLSRSTTTRRDKVHRLDFSTEPPIKPPKISWRKNSKVAVMENSVTSAGGDLDATVKPKSILDIPPEIIQYIFLKLTQKDLLNLRLTCTYFRDEAGHPSVLSLHLITRSYSPKDFRQMMTSMSSLMPNVSSLHLVSERSTDVDSELILLKDNCIRLKILDLESCDVGLGVSMSNLPDTLSDVTFGNVMFEDPNSFFSPESCAKFGPVMTDLKLLNCNFGSPESLTGIAAFSNLRVLHLLSAPTLDDDSFAKLSGRLPNLVELHLVSLPIGDESFRTIGASFRKLEELLVKECPNVRGEGFAAIKDNTRLEELTIGGCCVNDDSVRTVLDRLVNLRQVSFQKCAIENRTMRSICQGLPNLEYLELHLNRPGITDLGIRDVIMHNCLEEMHLVGVMLTDSGMTELVRGVPNLRKLYVLTCAITDVGFKAIAEGLPLLEQLILNDTLVTDVGLASYAPKLGALDHLEIDSVNFSENGVLPIIDYLSKIGILDISFVGSGGGLHVHRRCPYNKMHVKKFISPEFAEKVLPAFKDVKMLSLSDIVLSVSDVERIAECHPHLELFFVYDGRSTDEVALAILEKLWYVRELHIYNCCVTDVTFTALKNIRKDSPLQNLSFECDCLPSEETIVSVAPVLTALHCFDICTADVKNQIAVTGRDILKKLTVTGRVVDDSVLLALVPHIKNLCEISISATSVTLAGLKAVAPFFTMIRNLELDVSEADFTGDDAASVIGELVTCDLKSLSIEGGTLTDAGLPLLGRHLTTLDTLLVIRSSVTVTGITAMAKELSGIDNIVFRGHPNLIDVLSIDGIHFEDGDQEDTEED